MPILSFKASREFVRLTKDLAKRGKHKDEAETIKAAFEFYDWYLTQKAEGKEVFSAVLETSAPPPKTSRSNLRLVPKPERLI